ncbi:hypothetical protein F5879DRAFT_1066158 [Lentinula edodes]|nr:hypothetical protein F5879DRAFT_1066158 [Lentinula edodes]
MINIYFRKGPLIAAVAYLDVGCGADGQGCTMVETTLVNPTTPGSGSSTDITLIPPHSFSIATGFGYFNGCNGAGADCTNANCPTAFHNPNNTHVQVACQSDNVTLVITFSSFRIATYWLCGRDVTHQRPKVNAFQPIN